MAKKAKKKEPKEIIEKKPIVQEVPETDGEDMNEQEVAAMEERAKQRKDEAKAKIEATVDTQHWSLVDPIIPEELTGRVWIAVYRCPDGHKTKATNRQADKGILCFKHGELGQKVIAQIVPMFLEKPIPPTDDIEKRKKARKGAE